MGVFDDIAEQVQRVTHSSQLKSIVGRIVAELRTADDEAGVAARFDALEARLKAVEARLAEGSAESAPARRTASRKAGG